MRYSLVIPIYNDAYLARDFCIAFRDVMEKHLARKNIEDEVELIFVNDGSADDSITTLKALVSNFAFVRVIDLSRNFGQHIAIACGLAEARGQIVGRANVDMQDPVLEIPRMLQALEQSDTDIIVGVYQERFSKIRDKLSAYFFYKFFNWLSNGTTPQNTSSLRFMSRRYVDAYNKLNEKTRFPQGLDNWLGFNHRYISIAHSERKDGQSSYTFKKRVKLGVDAALSFSERPLRLIFWLGVAFLAFGAAYSAYLIAWRFLSPDPIPGYASLVILFVTFCGIQNLCLGIVAQYIGKILQEVLDRPLFLVKDRYEPSQKARDDEHAAKQ
ncbi:MAG: glycosyltransferase family 2 protein [Bradyrhizobium sp.]|nr:glycosyltransferase family 2 protein [Bradyrhizobium sp.]